MEMDRENPLYSSKVVVPAGTSSRQTKNLMGNPRNESHKRTEMSSPHSPWLTRKLQTHAQGRCERAWWKVKTKESLRTDCNLELSTSTHIQIDRQKVEALRFKVFKHNLHPNHWLMTRLYTQRHNT